MDFPIGRPFLARLRLPGLASRAGHFFDKPLRSPGAPSSLHSPARYPGLLRHRFRDRRVGFKYLFAAAVCAAVQKRHSLAYEVTVAISSLLPLRQRRFSAQ